MEKKIVYSLVMMAVITALGFRSAAHSYLAISDGPLKDVVLHPTDPSRLLAISQRGVYMRGESRDWKLLFSFHGNSTSLRQLIPHPALPEKIFLVAEDSVLEGNLKTRKSRWIFREPDHQRNRVHALAIHPEDPHQIYLGTERGLFLSGDGGKTWLPPFRWPENQPIQLVAFLPTDPVLIILGTNEELFFSKDGGETFESGFSLPPFKKEETEEDSEENSDPAIPRFTSLAFSAKDPHHLWIGTLGGVFESRDGGVVWQKLPDRGLRDRRVYDLVYSERSGLIGASHSGVARFLPDEKRWENLPIGLTQPPQALALSPESKKGTESLLIASGSEVFEWILDPPEISNSRGLFLPSPERMELFRRLLNREPTAREIQKAAIRYASLGNGKIQRWHWGSRMRAFVPRVSFGKTFSVGNHVDVDRGGTNNPDVFIMGPDDINKGWNVGLTWELGDFLYSSAQTSIDSRAKLLVELRESILSEVTRIYFERRRVQMELAFSQEKTAEEYFDLLLRMDEFTAQLDALTDGFFSRELEKIYDSEPELKDLWNGLLNDLGS